MSIGRKRKPATEDSTSAASEVPDASADDIEEDDDANAMLEADSDTVKRRKKDAVVEDAPDDKHDASAEAKLSLKEISQMQQRLAERPLAFVVNIPLPLKATYEETISEMNKVQAAYNLLSDHPPFKIVFCVNSRKENAADLLKTFADQFRADQMLSAAIPSSAAAAASATPKMKYDYDVITLKFKEGNKIPYGKFRNTLLHSDATANAIKKFMMEGFYPYISIGDADIGRRTTFVNDHEVHIFRAIEERLTYKPVVPEEHPIYARPYVIAGGYRVATVKAATVEVEADAEAKTAKKEIPSSGTAAMSTIPPTAAASIVSKPVAVDPMYEAKVQSINSDMFIRRKISEFHTPLAPYFPEPNLFIDGLIILADNLNKKREIEFGPGAAEFSQLRKSLDEYIKKETLAQLRDVGFPDEALDEYLENNRHPYRHHAVVACFDLTIETDTARLFKDAILKDNIYQATTVAQHHGDITNSKDAFVYNRKNNSANLTKTYKDIRKLVKEIIKAAAEEKGSKDFPLDLARIEQEIVRQLKEGVSVKKESDAYPAPAIRKRIDKFLSSCRNLDKKHNRTVPNLSNPLHLGLSIWKSMVYANLTPDQITQYEKLKIKNNDSESDKQVFTSRFSKLAVYAPTVDTDLLSKVKKIESRIIRYGEILNNIASDKSSKPVHIVKFNTKLHELLTAFSRVEAAIQKGGTTLGPKAATPLPATPADKVEISPEIIPRVDKCKVGLTKLVSDLNQYLAKIAKPAEMPPGLPAASTAGPALATSSSLGQSDDKFSDVSFNGHDWIKIREQILEALKFVFPNERESSQTPLSMGDMSASGSAVHAEPDYNSLLQNYRNLQLELYAQVMLAERAIYSPLIISIVKESEQLLSKLDNKIAWAEDAITEQSAISLSNQPSDAKLDTSSITRPVPPPSGSAAAGAGSGAAAAAVTYYASQGNLFAVSPDAFMSLSPQAVVDLKPKDLLASITTAKH